MVEMYLTLVLTNMKFKEAQHFNFLIVNDF